MPTLLQRYKSSQQLNEWARGTKPLALSISRPESNHCWTNDAVKLGRFSNRTLLREIVYSCHAAIPDSHALVNLHPPSSRDSRNSFREDRCQGSKDPFRIPLHLIPFECCLDDFGVPQNEQPLDDESVHTISIWYVDVAAFVLARYIRQESLRLDDTDIHIPLAGCRYLFREHPRFQFLCSTT